MNADVRPIVVAVAEKQHAALAYAVAYCRHREIRVVHAFEVLPSETYSIYAYDVAIGFEAAGRDVLSSARDYIETLAPPTPVDYILTRGFTPAVLIQETTSAAEIILGPDKSPWLVRLFQGNVTRRLTEAADCPVVVVPDCWSWHQARQDVLICVDTRATSHGLLEYAFTTADSRGVALRVLNTTGSGEPEPNDASEWNDFHHFLGSWCQRFPRIAVTIANPEGDPSSVGPEIFQSVGIIVIGKPHHNSISLLHKPLGQKLIETAQCPVAIVPPLFRAGNEEDHGGRQSRP